MLLLPLILMSSIVLMATTSMTAQGCDQTYTSRSRKRGTFTSPQYPMPYPERARCKYEFKASNDERIKITFITFDLEEAADTGCEYDYIAVYSIDWLGYRLLINHFCGSVVPSPIIVAQPKLEIIFMSDYTKSMMGFKATYDFLDDSKLPFSTSLKVCGRQAIRGESGIVTSPRFPNAFPSDTECTWLLSVRRGHQILISMLKIDLGNDAHCSDFALSLYNGVPTPSTRPDLTICGRSSWKRSKQFISATSKVLIRFVAAGSNKDKRQGFKFVWTSITLTETDYCPKGLLCSARKHCTNSIKGSDSCIQLPRFCAPFSVRCNTLPNCGLNDDTDEKSCENRTLMISLILALLILTAVISICIAVYCYYRHKHIVKSQSQEQSLTRDLHTLEQSPSESRHCRSVMHQTSFVDSSYKNSGMAIESPAEDKIITLEINDGACNLSPCGENMVTFNSLKRNSYHLMRQQGIDEGNCSSATTVITADI